MKSKTKRIGMSIGKKALAMALSCTMACSMVGTVVSASAITAIDPSSRLGANSSKYYSQFSSNEEVLAATKEKNIEFATEGAILLKNGGGVNGNEDMLPYKDMKNISLFGINSDAYAYGGTGSGSGLLEEGADIYTSFENAGLNINPKLKAMYQRYSGGSLSAVSGYTTPTYEDNELPMSYYTEDVTATYERYDDAAFVFIMRLGGEGADLDMEDVDGERPRPDENGNLVDDLSEHYLELSYKEEQLIEHVKENFDKVVILFNSGNIIEFGELENDPGIDAIVNIGQTGDYGMDGILKVLKGEVSPSGRTVDIYTADFTVDPTYQNMGNGAQTVASGNNYALTYLAEGATRASSVTNSVEYEEGIYLGYKYYETMYSEIEAGNVDLDAEATKAVLGSDDLGDDYADADDWYDKNVVYPFGYGLSYTTFDWEFDSLEMSTATLTMDTVFTAEVTVTNTGDYASKDVVELYMTAPYTAGGIEKAATQLIGYAKTPTIQPGESATVEVVFDAYDIAAYDWSDANDNGYATYEIEAGRYVFNACKNSHEVVDSQTMNFSGLIVDEAKATGVTIENRFVDSPDPDARFDYTSISPTMTIMTRADMIETFPTAPTAEEREYTPGEDNYNKAIVDELDAEVTGDLSLTEEDVYNKVTYGYIFGGDYDGSKELWAENVNIPDTWTQAATASATVAIRLPDMMGISPYSTEVVESDNEELDGLTGEKAWEKFLNQLTYAELKTLVHTGFFKTAGIDRIGKEEAVDPDGPCTIGGQTKDGYSAVRGGSGTRYWCSMQMLAATWNIEFAKEFGNLVGEEALWNNYNGWYAPSMNIHRSPFSGRNFEYYSQDAVQGGLIAGAVISSVSAHGVYPYIKHFALNDQETSRNDIATWADEQTIRENYLKNFQYAVEQGGSCGIMTGFNRIGMIDCPENYALMTQILREEWGFDGSVVTDYQVGTVGAAHNNMEVFHYAGTNIPLADRAGGAQGQGQWDETLRNGQGGVRVGVATRVNNSWSYSTTEFITSDDTDNMAADIAYYYTRTRAMEILHTHVRSNAIDNGADFQLNFAAQTIEVPAGIPSYTAEIPVGFDADDIVSYELVESELPEGVTFNAENCAFTVRNATVDTTGTVDVKAYYDGWASKTVTFRVNVVPAVTLNGATALTPNAAYTATISQNYWTIGSNNVTAVVPSATGLPEGLTFDAATETISGTPTATGEYVVTFNYAVTETTTNSSGQQQNSTRNYSSTYTFTVGEIVTVTIDGVENRVGRGTVMTAPEAPEAPEGKQFAGWYADDAKFDFSQAITEDVTIVSVFENIPDDIEFRVQDGKIQASINGGEWTDVIDVEDLRGPQGVQGEVGPEGPAGADAKGCGGVIGVSSALAATVVLGAAALVLRKKED